MPKINMFVVAPYEGLNELILKTSKDFPCFNVKTAVGNLSTGVQHALEAERAGCQIIMSRGGTAEMIERAVSIPVVNIDISGFDYIRTITLANGFTGRAAMIGYRNITEGALAIRELLKSTIDIYTIDSSDELPLLLNRLQQEGYRVVVGDVITLEKAQKMGFDIILLTSGVESVKKAFFEAQRIYGYISRYQLESSLLKKMIDESGSYFALLDSNETVLYKKLPPNEEAAFLQELRSHLKTVGSTGEQTMLYRDGGSWVERGKRIVTDDKKEYFAYYVSKLEEKDTEKAQGITIENLSDLSDFDAHRFDQKSDYLKETFEKAQAYSRLRVPILILGEIGTGKDLLARTIHFIGENRFHPFLMIDCETADHDSLQQLMEQGILKIDPLSTLYIRKINMLETDDQKSLFDFLSSSQYSQTHLVLVSLCESPEALMASGLLHEGLGSLIGKYRISLPSLKERVNDIQNLTGNYINEANSRFGRQVAAVDDDALKLLCSFHWTANMDQLRRLVYQLVLSADGPYIRAASVEKELKKESVLHPGGNPFVIPQNKTLDEIILDIIREVVKEENHNFTRASERLGVSRSTIWRKLKEQ